MWEYQARFGRLIDGDTMEILVDCGFYTRRHITIRLAGLDTAEIYGVSHDSEEFALGQRQADFVDQWVHDGITNYDGYWPFVVRTEPPQGKYGRWPATLVRKCDRSVLNDDLVTAWPDVADDYAGGD